MTNTQLLWWLAAGALIIAELLTGTFYLLMVALACIAAGIAALAGLAASGQLLFAAVIACSLLLLLRLARFGLRKRGSTRNPDIYLDLGAQIKVSAWHDRRARVKYRGAQWDVELAEGESAAGVWYEIVEVRGNQLIVAAKRG